MKIEIRDLSLSFGKQKVLDHLNIDFEPSTLTCLLGRSGSGKTSILKIIAGILEPDNGQIFFNGDLVNSVPTQQRQVGWVPQQQLIFPGLSVKENIIYGLKARNKPREVQIKRLNEVAELVGLTDLIDRKPDGLSGGEKQRVALARAIAPEPKILLLDEPFSSLDAPERDRLSLAFRQVQLETDVTTIHVTHSPREAELISDMVHILSNGEIIQSETFSLLQENPNSTEVAKLLNIPNFVETSKILEIKIPSIIPMNSITIGQGQVMATVLSSNQNRIYLQIEDIILETYTSTNHYSVGDQIKVSINHDKVKSIG